MTRAALQRHIKSLTITEIASGIMTKSTRENWQRSLTGQKAEKYSPGYDMAYLIVLTSHVCTVCGHRAYAEVIGERNVSHGFYCHKHADAELAQLNSMEAVKTPARIVGLAA